MRHDRRTRTNHERGCCTTDVPGLVLTVVTRIPLVSHAVDDVVVHRPFLDLTEDVGGPVWSGTDVPFLGTYGVEILLRAAGQPGRETTVGTFVVGQGHADLPDIIDTLRAPCRFPRRVNCR